MRQSVFSSLPLTALLVLGCAGQKAATTGQSQQAAASAGTLSAADRQAALAYLEETRQAFLTSIKGLSDAQYRYKPAPDRWSIAETAEHIAVSEERIFDMLTNKIMREPVSKELLSQVQHDDERLRRMVTDRSHKVQAPEVLRPTDKFASMQDITTAFENSRGKVIAYVKDTQDDLRGHAAPHPVLKALDGYQWVLLLSAHSARHTAQIEEVKADAHFPGK